jgi:hypothetical protein
MTDYIQFSSQTNPIETLNLVENYKKIILYLIDSGADINEIGDEGTPLDCAKCKNIGAFCEMMTQKRKNGESLTAIDLITEFLIQRGAKKVSALLTENPVKY